MHENNHSEEKHYRESLLKYAQSYVAKKRKTKSEQELEETPRKYVIYARKSTEDDKRQVQSIEDQIEQCKKFAKDNNLEVVEILREEKSAKTASKREKFAEMLERLYKGDFYNAILSWHPDRLSRNMKESGEILDMLDNDFILDLKFPSYSFNNDAAGKMTLSILFAMAKEFSDKLSEDTKRGNRKKVSEGKYMGNKKRGYIVTEKDYFRPHPDSYDLYQNAWNKYSKLNNQTKVANWLRKQDEEISDNMMSEYFRDPFPAGIYCYGDQIIDLTKVDPKFKPMITAKQFLEVQRVNKEHPRGWSNTDEFRPFGDLVICGDCGSMMTSAVNKGKVYRYLNIACGNKKCKAKRRKEGKTPLSPRIRGAQIIEMYESALKELKSIPEDIYTKVKEKYMATSNDLLASYDSEIKSLKLKLGKFEAKEKRLSDEILDQTSVEVKKKFSDELQSVIKEANSLRADIEKLEAQKSEIEYQISDDFPPYNDFTNFFEKASQAIKDTSNAYLVDQLVKMVFTNFKVEDKKISQYWLREPFSEYKKLKILNGVQDGTRTT